MRPAGLLAVFLAALMAAATVHAGELRAGAAVEVITPALGAPMAGYYSPRAAEGVIDDLYAKALVLEQDGTKVALVVCDLISMPRDVAIEARGLIEQSVKIPADHVMISATHTHTGPILPSGSARAPARAKRRTRPKRTSAPSRS